MKPSSVTTGLRLLNRYCSRGFSTKNSSKNLPLSELTSVSPLDGRYARQTIALREMFSEFALIRKRVVVETKWLESLGSSGIFKELDTLDNNSLVNLERIRNEFSLENAQRVKEIEKVTNHDVKSVEYFVKEELEKLPKTHQLHKSSEFVHFGCTSEDVNNLSYGLMLKDAKEQVVLPKMEEIILTLKEFSINTSDVPMLSRTHGQSATPTTVGKEMANFTVRLARKKKQFSNVDLLGKFNGAVGNFAAHVVTDPSADWEKISKDFINDLGLKPNEYSTQIEPHDFIAEISDAVSGFNTVLLDLSRDMWSYTSLHYFKQKNIKGQVGSSTMPHKINPIDFENCEGNLELANALFALFRRKLPISRFQRDLSDSTVLRSLGVAFGHSLIAYASLLRGFGKISVNEEKLMADLEDNVEVLAEPIQMVLRRAGSDKPYEKLKELTRGKKLNIEEVRKFISNLDLGEEDKSRLLELTPSSYTGFSAKLSSRKKLDDVLNAIEAQK